MIRVKTNEMKEKPFPKLMITTEDASVVGRIVFFTEPRVGICLIPITNTSYVGEYYKDWVMKYFTDYNEPITIQNA